MKSFKLTTTLLALAIMLTALGCSDNGTDTNNVLPLPIDKPLTKIVKYSEVLLGDEIKDADIIYFYEHIFDGTIENMEYSLVTKTESATKEHQVFHRYILNQELTKDGKVCFDVYEYYWADTDLLAQPEENPTFIRRYYFERTSDGRIYREAFVSQRIISGINVGNYTEMTDEFLDNRLFELKDGKVYEHTFIDPSLPLEHIWIKQTNGSFYISYPYETDYAVNANKGGRFIEGAVIKTFSSQN